MKANKLRDTHDDVDGKKYFNFIAKKREEYKKKHEYYPIDKKENLDGFTL